MQRRNILIAVGAAAALALGAYYFGLMQGGRDTSVSSFFSQPTSTAPVKASSQQSTSGESAGFEVDSPITEMLLSLKGVWQSDSDARFTREFRIDKTLSDTYVAGQNTASTEGYYSVFAGSDAPADAYFPLDQKGRYLTINTKEGQSLHYQITRLTSTKLELLYLDRGGSLTFTKMR